MRRNPSTGAGTGLRAFAGLAVLVLTAAAPATVPSPSPSPAPAPAAATQPEPPPASGPAPMPPPQPYFPSVEERSGLLNRFIPIQPWLPHDKYRDTFYDTRWADCPDKHPNHPNIYKNGGGLYGRRWPGYCTQSFYPYFFGSPGQGTIGPGCMPWHRMLKLPQTFLHPLRPVCYYYDQGTYVPMYDLDPVVPGPGPVPYFFPFYLRNPHGG